MSGSASSNGPARTPEGLHALLEHAFNHTDLDVYTDAHEDDATLVVPPEGGTVHGRDNIRAAIVPMFTRQPHLRSVVQKKLEGNSLALTHARLDAPGPRRRREAHGAHRPWDDRLATPTRRHLEDRAR